MAPNLNYRLGKKVPCRRQILFKSGAAAAVPAADPTAATAVPEPPGLLPAPPPARPAEGDKP